MVLQAFIDDSYSGAERNNRVYVLAGYIATAGSWANFSKEWERLLPWTPFNKHNKRVFKFHAMPDDTEQDKERLLAFQRVIDEYVLCSVSFAFRYKDWEYAKRRITIPGVLLNYGEFDNDFMFAFHSMIGMFHDHDEFNRKILKENKVEFYFDTHPKKKLILTAWDEFVENRPSKIRERIGNKPHFEKDEEFLQLQAADFCAGYIRTKLERNMHPFDNPLYGWTSTRLLPHFHMSLTENDMVNYLSDSVWKESGRTVVTYNVPIKKAF